MSFSSSRLLLVVACLIVVASTSALALPTIATTTTPVHTGPYHSYPDQATVTKIGDFDDGETRNLAISQGYFELSRALIQFLGTEEANWPTYAVWASNSVGYGIRNETVDSLIDLYIRPKYPIVAQAMEMFPLMKIGFYRQLMTHCTENLAMGNMIVWKQVGKAMSGLLTLFGQDTTPDYAKMDQFLSEFDPRPAPTGEMELMQATRYYLVARFESDPKNKSELIALGNFLIGKSEQTLLQTALDGAFAPLVIEVPKILGGKVYTIPVEGLLTEAFTYDLPDEYLRVCRDVTRSINSTSDFPPNLTTIDNQDLIAVFDYFRVPFDTLNGTKVFDWLVLEQRMRFVIAMFRTRQMDKSLWHCYPFNPSQVEDIHRLEFPKDKKFCLADCACDWAPIL